MPMCVRRTFFSVTDKYIRIYVLQWKSTESPICPLFSYSILFVFSLPFSCWLVRSAMISIGCQFWWSIMIIIRLNRQDVCDIYNKNNNERKTVISTFTSSYWRIGLTNIAQLHTIWCIVFRRQIIFIFWLCANGNGHNGTIDQRIVRLNVHALLIYTENEHVSKRVKMIEKQRNEMPMKQLIIHVQKQNWPVVNYENVPRQNKLISPK